MSFLLSKSEIHTLKQNAVTNFAVAVLAEITELAARENKPIRQDGEQVDSYIRLSDVQEVINKYITVKEITMTENILLNTIFPKQQKSLFNEEQLIEIALGFEFGLSQEKMDILAKPEFSRQQMVEISRGFKQGLTVKEVGVYAKADFTSEQMEQLRLGLVQGLSIDEVMGYAQAECTFKEMSEKRGKLILEYAKQMASDIQGSKEFSSLQKKELLKGLKGDISIRWAKKIANPVIHHTHMRWIRKHLNYSKISERCFNLYLQPGFTEEQLNEIMLGFMEGLVFYDVASYADPKLSVNEMRKTREMCKMNYPKMA